jgi:hypothetical protein
VRRLFLADNRRGEKVQGRQEVRERVLPGRQEER